MWRIFRPSTLDPRPKGKLSGYGESETEKYFEWIITEIMSRFLLKVSKDHALFQVLSYTIHSPLQARAKTRIYNKSDTKGRLISS